MGPRSARAGSAESLGRGSQQESGVTVGGGRRDVFSQVSQGGDVSKARGRWSPFFIPVALRPEGTPLEGQLAGLPPLCPHHGSHSSRRTVPLLSGVRSARSRERQALFTRHGLNVPVTLAAAA